MARPPGLQFIAPVGPAQVHEVAQPVFSVIGSAVRYPTLDLAIEAARIEAVGVALRKADIYVRDATNLEEELVKHRLKIIAALGGWPVENVASLRTHDTKELSE